MTDAAKNDPLDALTGKFEEWVEWMGVKEADHSLYLAAFTAGFFEGIDRGMELADAAERDEDEEYYDILSEYYDNEQEGEYDYD